MTHDAFTSHVIQLGPYTIVTVDEGYAAVTQNNGKQMILKGGEVHLLKHRNWKFEKFMSEKLQTNNLEALEATSADNVLMKVQATVAWRISNVEVAARMAAETMNADGSNVRRGDDITKLRNDVLKQSEASLSSFIGTVNYSSTFSVSAVVQGAAVSGTSLEAVPAAPAPSQHAPSADPSPLFDAAQLRTAVEHANDITNTYGVTVISINIISAKPADSDLMNSLAKGAVAAAEALQAETAARGQARAEMIEAEGHASSEVTRAKGDAEAQKIRAEGARLAAETLAQSEVAVTLAQIEKTGTAIGDNATYFFGADASNLGALLTNPKVVTGKPKH